MCIIDQGSHFTPIVIGISLRYLYWYKKLFLRKTESTDLKLHKFSESKCYEVCVN